MPYQPHTYLTFGGRLTEKTSRDEIWQCGIRGFTSESIKSPIDQSQLQLAVDTIAVSPAGLNDWWALGQTGAPNNATLEWVKMVNINAAGDYAGDPVMHEYASPLVGAATPSTPSFLSVALSFTTGKTFGRAKFGRVYPPNYGGIAFTGSQISSGNQASRLESAKQLIQTLTRSASEWGFTPFVVSRSGVSNVITGVRVGDVLDVQRRRKNAVSETYVATAV